MRAPGGISLLEISSLAPTATMRSLVARSPLCSAPAPRQGEREGKSRKRGISSGLLCRRPRSRPQSPKTSSHTQPSAPGQRQKPWGAEVAYVVLILAFSNYLLFIPEFAWAVPDTLST